MEPIDKRITAAHLMTLRSEQGCVESIAELLGVKQMPVIHAERTLKEIQTFVDTGDAVLGSQLIHSASVRQIK